MHYVISVYITKYNYNIFLLQTIELYTDNLLPKIST